MTSTGKTTILTLAVATAALTSLPAAGAGQLWRPHHPHSVERSDLTGAGLADAGAPATGLSVHNATRDPVFVNPRPRPYRGPAYTQPGDGPEADHEIVHVDADAVPSGWRAATDR